MPNIIFINANGSRTNLEIAVGKTLMHAAVAVGIDGIIGECGGSAMCATCHVLVDLNEQKNRGLPPISAVEDAMLDSAATGRQSESRLSCQLAMTEAFDGMEVTLPERQL